MKVDVDTEIELCKCPHILIGGCTGSGKTYLMRHMIEDVLNGSEGDIRLVVVDPKNVDYQYLRNDERWLYQGIDLIDRDGIDSGYCNQVLGWLCEEMAERYRIMKSEGIYNWGDLGRERILLLVDELTDLIYYDRDKSRGVMRGSIERSLVRLSMLGRAAGLHLMLGTQRPDAQTLPGQLRANIGCRICLRVSTETERRIVLGQSGKGYGERSMEYLSNIYSLKYELD